MHFILKILYFLRHFLNLLLFRGIFDSDFFYLTQLVFYVSQDVLVLMNKLVEFLQVLNFNCSLLLLVRDDFIIVLNHLLLPQLQHLVNLFKLLFDLIQVVLRQELEPLQSRLVVFDPIRNVHLTCLNFSEHFSDFPQ